MNMLNIYSFIYFDSVFMSLVVQMVNSLLAMQETQVRYLVCVRSPAEGNSNPLQYSCLENFMDRGTSWAIVHGIAKSWTRLSD